MPSFRASLKLRLASLWPALAAVGVAAILLAYLIPRLLEHSACEQLQDALDILAPAVTPQLEIRTDRGAGELQEWVRTVAGGSDLRWTVVAADGTVLADSKRSQYQLGRMDNHNDRPEIRQAWIDGRGTSVRWSATTGQRYAYAARAVEGAGGKRWMLRLAQPVEGLLPLRRNLLTTMALALGTALLAMVVISWWLDRWLFRPLALLIAGARQLAAGRYRHRVEVPEEDELADLALALNHMAGRVEEQILKVEAERDHLQAILSSMSEGVLVVDREGRAVSANPSFLRSFRPEGDIEGKLPLEIGRLVELAAIIERTLEQGRPFQGEVEIRSPERRTFALTTAALEGGDSGAVVVVRDTTESQRLGEIRRDFVANVSHELKTPLAAIRGFAETLREGALGDPEAAHRFLDRILDQCRRLQALLNDLLILSKLESVELPALPREPVDLDRLVRRAVELVAPAADERRITLAIEDGPVPPVPGNAEGLERLMLNLLDNAVKYNRPGGHVKVRLMSFRRPGGSGQVVLEVSDDGIGIPADALPRIFERFYRVDKGRSREEGGTGLGLAIVKHVAQAHEGRVEVESELGRGTTFRVRLPLPPEVGAAGG